MRFGPASALSSLTGLTGGAARALRRTTRRARRGARRSAIAAPLDTGGFLGASLTAWISTSPSLLPRTWWMWAANIGLSEVYGYAAGALAGRAVRRAGAAIGLEVDIAPDHRRRARWAGACALVGITAYSWVRGVMRQREISHLVHQEPKNLATHLVGTAAGAGFAGDLAVPRRAGPQDRLRRRGGVHDLPHHRT